ncbi:hypothetical protein KD050_14080 [Psychrobacillus sp. INOP01]|uniref:hypothetical protein n=1 Tax=Psychrobacillus sp. INOP01 TaxID=2829187 RepID=UPI001BAAC5E6|nr:hypothetical protein [Psychrobacillus sp. INOP01]QUG40415.1 hypothetical protein KD050_14080 [Psychrobacillus sp. INOP01]
MTKTLVDKAKSILTGLEIGFDTAKNWNEDNYDDYYQYFSHPDFEVRKYSLLVFAAGLGNWLSSSCFIFPPIEELESGKYLYLHQDKIYHFECYVKSFVDNREVIKQEFPLLYTAIVCYLIDLDNEKRFDIFKSVDKQLFIVLRKVLGDSELEGKRYRYSYNGLLREVGLPKAFFKD